MTTTTAAYTPPVETIPVAEGWSTPINLGPPVNTLGWEDSAFISPDGKTLYFSYANFDWLTFMISGKRVKTGPDKGLNPTDLCDAMVSQKTDSGWTEPKLLEINELYVCTDGVVTQDGETMYFSGLKKNNTGGPGKSDIYVSRKQDGKWQQEENLGPPVNTNYSEGNPWISEDGNLLMFESDRPEGKGDSDIWMAEKKDGKWSEPMNLGKSINSPKKEEQPFMSRDGKMLYFSGDSRKKPGDRVIFLSEKKDGKWSEPKEVISNLVGEPTLTSDGKELYFVHIFKTPGGGYNADIMMTKKTS
ncbi:PD40 domain-containing protein [Candidatus Micrarchaeota archaeon]|nr:PD40 domain-containing protein [Candidatus Micrarchaeota archaeon]